MGGRVYCLATLFRLISSCCERQAMGTSEGCCVEYSCYLTDKAIEMHSDLNWIQFSSVQLRYLGNSLVELFGMSLSL